MMDFLKKLKDFSGDISLMNPSVMVPAETIENGLQSFLSQVKAVEAISLRIETGRAKITFSLRYGLRFSLTLELVPLEISHSADVLSFTFRQAAPPRVVASGRLKRRVLQMLVNAGKKMAASRLAAALTDETIRLKLEGDQIYVRMTPDLVIENLHLPGVTRPLLKVLRVRDMAFESGRIRLYLKPAI